MMWAINKKTLHVRHVCVKCVTFIFLYTHNGNGSIGQSKKGGDNELYPTTVQAKSMMSGSIIAMNNVVIIYLCTPRSSRNEPS